MNSVFSIATIIKHALSTESCILEHTCVEIILLDTMINMML